LSNSSKEKINSNFIYNAINDDIKNNIYTDNRVHTRFPPEPNGYLHIGHAKAALLNFRTAVQYNGKFNLRFDDTNPSKEDVEYVDSIIQDLKWLGIDWDNRQFFASDYFQQMYDYAVELIHKGLAFVDDLSADEMREYRGNLTTPGKNSPYRERSINENLTLFTEMKNGKYTEGEKVLRAKIDMGSPNMNMRDPVIYRIMNIHHHNTQYDWCVYPMYDFAHPLEDAIEGITHSLCSLEFEDHRPFYNWVLSNLDDYKNEAPRQIEFARLNITQTIMSKRYLKQLVDTGIVDSWDDPRLSTLSGMRRRGYTADSIKKFCSEIGVAKANSEVDIAMLEHFIRDDLKFKAPRIMTVLDPLKLTITNYPDEKIEWLEIDNNQDVPEMGKRKVPFEKHLYIERDDFMENPPKKFFRLFPGNEVRLRGAYFIKCEEVIKDDNNKIIEIKCTYDPETKSGSGFKGRKVKGTIHWVSANNNHPIEVRLYDYLLSKDTSFEKDNFLEKINKNSLTILNSLSEVSIKQAKAYDKFQFIRKGFYSVDPFYTTEEKLVFNQIVPLKSSWKPNKK
jgi:glutaminyl-tRNA synthetase